MKITTIYWISLSILVFSTAPTSTFEVQWIFRPLSPYVIILLFQQILYELRCVPVPPLIHQCNYTTINKTHGIMSLDFFYPVVLEKLQFHIQVFYKYPRLGFKPFLIDTLQDACQIFKTGSSFTKFGEIITPNILRNVYNLHCPVEVSGRNGISVFCS